MDIYEVSKKFVDLGCGYPVEALEIAMSRGWDPDKHIDALLGMNDDEIGLSHPSNWLNEDEFIRTFENPNRKAILALVNEGPAVGATIR
jgi:hypothetical protein